MSVRPPVVVLPGVMGSRLFFPRSNRFWDPDRPLRMARWAPVPPFRSDDDNRRALHAREPAGVVADTKDVSEAERDRGWSTVVWSFYGGLLRRLAGATGGDVFAVGYDWRQGVLALGEFAAHKFRGVLDRTGADRLVVVTHSMGGLVARAALRDPVIRDKVAAVVHVCQPSVGAVVLYRRLFTGLVPGLDGGGRVADRAFRLLLGGDQRAFVGNMSGLPGPMQLLPTRHYPAAGGPWHDRLLPPGRHDDLYANPASPPGIVPDPGRLPMAAAVRADLSRRVAELAEFEETLGPPAADPELVAKTWLIYGTGCNTEVGVAAGHEGAPTKRLEGDEVVPAASATALGLPPERTTEVFGLTHADACQNGQVQDAVLGIYFAAAGGPTPDRTETAFSFPGAVPAAAGRPALGAAARTADDAAVGRWLREGAEVAARVGARVRVTVEFDPPARN